MEKCQELQDAVDALLDAMRENGGIYDSHLDAHEHHMNNMINRRVSMLSVFIMNRDNMSDEDAEEIVKTITTANNIAILAFDTEKYFK